MKKIALASAIALASISAAHAAPTVYGKVLLTGEYNNTDYEDNAKNDESVTKLQSNSSRIGFKGDEEPTDTTKLVYQLEYGVDVDAASNKDSKGNDKNQFYSRNTFLGLAHNTMGTVLAGRHDTPYKLAKGGVDVFNDYDNVGLGNLMAGENRADNVLDYKSPAIVGMPLTFMAAVALSENDNDAKKVLSTKTTTTASQTANLSGTKTVVETVTANDTKTKDNAYSASLAYDENGVYLAGGYDNNVGSVDSAWRLAGSVDMGKMNMVQGLTLGALYQNSSYLDGVYTKVTTDTSLEPSATNPKTESSKKDYENEKSWLLSAKYKFNDTPWAVKAQYINTSNYKGEKDTDATEIALGAEYTINKAAKAHMYAAQINTDKSAKNADIDKTIVGAGLEYKF